MNEYARLQAFSVDVKSKTGQVAKHPAKKEVDVGALGCRRVVRNGITVQRLKHSWKPECIHPASRIQDAGVSKFGTRN